jgi:CRISPR-associated protein Cas5t
MQALAIKLYQDHVIYRQETSFRYWQTYPLPTPSMVRGMVHALLKADAYIPLEISIQGRYGGIFQNLQRVNNWTGASWDAIQKELASPATLLHEMLTDVELFLHIRFINEQDNKKYLPQLKDELIRQTIVLGRNEDIARLDEIKLVDLRIMDIFSYETRYNLYVQKSTESVESSSYSSLRLPFMYQVEDKMRVFKFVDVVFVPYQQEIGDDFSEDLLFDPIHKIPVAFLKADL